MSEELTESEPAAALIDLPARTLFDQVADPAHSSGGGVVAGVTLAGAAATAELVLKLAARRKSLASRADEVTELLNQIIAHRTSFEGSADRDIAAFSELVDTQRAVKPLRDQDPDEAHRRLQAAYVHAANIPLGLAREATEFMSRVEDGLQYASHFTISDLGAAAALARGAIDSALLTVDANLAYVDDDRAVELRRSATSIRKTASDMADRVMQRATEVISGKAKER